MLTVYKASAGSGKTYTLALEYIKLLLGVKDQATGRYVLNHPDHMPSGRVEPDRHRSILAVTFTNKATQEMKKRIIDELAVVAGPTDEGYVRTLMDTFGCTREQLAQVADSALDRLLLDYSQFNVSTIDAFFQTVLRAFAREVDCRGDYDLEINDAHAVVEGVGLLLDDVSSGTPNGRTNIVDWIKKYTYSRIDNKQSGNLFNRSSGALSQLISYVNKLGDEKFRQCASKMMDYLKSDPGMRRFMKAISDKVLAIYQPIMDEAKACIALIEAHLPDTAAFDKVVFRLLNTITTPEGLSAFKLKDYEDKARVQLCFLDELSDEQIKKFYVKTYLPTGKNKSDYIYPPDSVVLRVAALVRRLKQILPEVAFLSDIVDTCHKLEFMGYVWAYIDKFRRENNLLLISDTNELISTIIDGADAPFIYEKIGMHLQHFLIDEFQDTSHMQWQNLRPLVANSLSQGHDSLIIGDEKQSIYRFRNSDSTLLHHTVTNVDFPKHAHVKGTSPDENTNWRSSHLIVRFNNTLFSRLGRAVKTNYYANVTQALPDKTATTPGYIHIAKFETYTDPEGLEISDIEASMRFTAQAIIRQHQAGYRWRDIAVLTRKREQAAQFIDFIGTHYPQIAYSSEESLRLKQSPAVRQIIAMLKIMATPKRRDRQPVPGEQYYGDFIDTLNTISRYDYMLSNTDDAHLPASELALIAALQPVEESMEQIAEDLRKVLATNPTNLIALVEAIIKIKLDPEQCSREIAYVLAFVDTVIDYCRIFNPSLPAFIKWWDINSDKLTLISSAETDSVTIMTVHKSKGLQWPCVHIPFGLWELNRDEEQWFDMQWISEISPDAYPPVMLLKPNPQWADLPYDISRQYTLDVHAQQVDNLNALYVAFTRAERELYVSLTSAEATTNDLFINAISEKFDGVDSDLHIDIAAGEVALKSDESNESDESDRSLQGISRMWVYGQPTTAAPAPATSTATIIPPAAYTVNSRRDTQPIIAVESALSLRATIDTGDEAPNSPVDPDSDPRSERARRGTWLHAALSEVTRYDRLDHAITALSRRQDPGADLLEDYRRTLHEAFDKVPEWRDRWFVNHQRALDEQSIYDAERGETYRPDRIVITADGTLEVVDYKFTTEERPEHRRQVRHYLELLRAAGYASPRGYLWYPERALVIEVD